MMVATVDVLPDARTGFPLLVLPGLPFQVSWLPLTWMQLEYFLAETDDRRFDAAWYHELLAHTGRGSIAAGGATLPFTLFVRGLDLDTVRSLNHWWGEDQCFVPSADEWLALEQVARATPAVAVDQLPGGAATLNPRAVRLLGALEKTRSQVPGAPGQLADQMLLRGTLRELVLLDKVKGNAAAIGAAHRSLEPFAPKLLLSLEDASSTRRALVGIRLFLRL